MVKVQIPFKTPKDEGEKKSKSKAKKKTKVPSDDEVEDEESEFIGVMSDIEESDVDDDIGDPDWEEVPEDKDDNDDDFSFKPPRMPDLPSEGVTISLGPPKRRTRRSRGKKREGESDDESEEEEYVPKKKKPLDLNEIVRKTINRVKITEQLIKHKVSLIMYLARGLRLVRLINSNIIRGLSMSLVDFRLKPKKVKKQSDRQFVESFLKLFSDKVGICSDDDKRAEHMRQNIHQNMLQCYADAEATSLIELVVMFVGCLKATRSDISIRIANVLRPITLQADIIPKPAENGANESMGDKGPASSSSTANNNGKTSTTEVMSRKRKVEMIDPGIVEKLDFWVEVYLQDEKSWCCVDLCNVKVDEPSVLTELSKPISYLVTYDVDRYCVKPAEKNYCADWYTPAFRRFRCEDRWWDALMDELGPGKKSDKDHADEAKTEQVLVAQDMPTSDNGFRKHPLYVLERHLLKFEGLYPADVQPLGFFKDVPIYPRDCVRTLRSRETWLREARTVKLNESAYKVVKARPKRDKLTGDLIRDLPLELFGEWQTEDYKPPIAEGGKVPRNAYGNVDMYKPCMLPIGCEWLKLPGILRVANKLRIDCAAAVVGFDTNCGSYGAHPVIDGFIVCEEFADTLRMAWEEEQVNIAKRELDKQQKRVWDNWKRLVKAAIIREKLRVKYKNS